MAGRKDANGLTPKHLAFARAYVETGSLAEAYRKVYSTKNLKPETVRNNAYKLMQRGDVSTMVASLRAEADKTAVKDLGLTREYVISGLMSNAKAGAKEIQTKDGGTVPVNLAASNQAYIALGKIDTLGLFVEKSKIELSKTFDEMSDEELERYISENAKS